MLVTILTIYLFYWRANVFSSFTIIASKSLEIFPLQCKFVLCGEMLFRQTLSFANGGKQINAFLIILHAHKHCFGLRLNQHDILSS